jgi:hypothetical protein
MRAMPLTILVLSLMGGVALAQDMSRSSSVPVSSSEEVSSLPVESSEEMSSEESSMEEMSSSDESSSPDLEREGIPGIEVMQAVFDVCTDVASGDPEALDRAAGAGWQPGDAEEGGPYRIINSGFRSFAGYDDANFRAVTDTFPTQRLGYCSGSVGDPAGGITLADFAKIGDLKGGITDLGAGAYGAWESADGRIMVFAGKADGYLDFEFNLLLPPAP